MFKKGNVNFNTEKCGKLLFILSLPQILVALISNIVGFLSGAIIAGMNFNYLTAYSIISPISYSVFLSFLVGIFTGISSVIGRNIDNKENVKKIMFNSLILSFIGYILYVVVALIITKPYIASCTTKDVILKLAYKFALISFITNFIGIFYNYYSRILQALGEIYLTSLYSLISIPLTIVLNIVLIYGIGPFPQFGLNGIAYTNCIVWLLGSIFLGYITKKKGYGLFGTPKISKFYIRQILQIGIPSSIQQILATTLVSGYNIIIKEVSEDLVTIVGIFYKWNSILQSLILNTSLIPIIGYNYSHKNKKRLLKTIRYSVNYTLFSSIFVTLLYVLFAKKALEIFSCPPELMSLGMTTFRILVLYGVPMCLISVLQCCSIGLGDSKLGMCALIIQCSLTIGGGVLFCRTSSILTLISFTAAEYLTLIFVIIYIAKVRNLSSHLLKESIFNIRKKNI